jgi:hypothetical protein
MKSKRKKWSDYLYFYGENKLLYDDDVCVMVGIFNLHACLWSFHPNTYPNRANQYLVLNASNTKLIVFGLTGVIPHS